MAQQNSGRAPESTLRNTRALARRPRGRAAAHLSEPYSSVLDDYVVALRSAPVSEQTRRTYTSKVRQFLVWLAAGNADGEPLDAIDARDRAARDYRTYLQTELERKPTTINNALAAVDDLYISRGLGPAAVARVKLPKTAPRTLSRQAAIRFLHAVAAAPSPRDQAIALVAFYAGTRIGEIVALDIDDVGLPARNEILRIHRTGEKVREIPIHPRLRVALTAWLDARPNLPGADSPALFLNQQGRRLSVRGAHAIITAIAEQAGLDRTTAYILRHTFATRLVQGGVNLVTVAELLGHARLESTRVYAQPTPQDAVKALELLDVDR